MTNIYFYLPPKRIIRLNSPLSSSAEKKQFVYLALTPGIKSSPLSAHFHKLSQGRQVRYCTVHIFYLRVPPAGAARFENWLSVLPLVVSGFMIDFRAAFSARFFFRLLTFSSGLFLVALSSLMLCFVYHIF